MCRIGSQERLFDIYGSLEVADGYVMLTCGRIDTCQVAQGSGNIRRISVLLVKSETGFAVKEGLLIVSQPMIAIEEAGIELAPYSHRVLGHSRETVVINRDGLLHFPCHGKRISAIYHRIRLLPHGSRCGYHGEKSGYYEHILFQICCKDTTIWRHTQISIHNLQCTMHNL